MMHQDAYPVVPLCESVKADYQMNSSLLQYFCSSSPSLLFLKNVILYIVSSHASKIEIAPFRFKLCLKAFCVQLGFLS